EAANINCAPCSRHQTATRWRADRPTKRRDAERRAQSRDEGAQPARQQAQPEPERAAEREDLLSQPPKGKKHKPRSHTRRTRNKHPFCFVSASCDFVVNSAAAVSRQSSSTPRRLRRRAVALRERHVLARALAQIDLARARDLLFGIVEHLDPLRDPPGSAWDGEEHREHVHRKTHRAIDDARIEIYVRVEPTLDEVFIFERDAFEFERNV